MVCQSPMCRQECPEFGIVPLLLITFCEFHPFWFCNLLWISSLLVLTHLHLNP